MKIQELRAITFPKTDYHLWEKTAEASLNGKRIDSLLSNTYENIQLKPIYYESNTSPEELPGSYPFTRGILSEGYKERPWGICQKLRADNCQSLLEQIDYSISRGQNTISFDFSKLTDLNQESFNNLMQTILSKKLPIYLDITGMQSVFANYTEHYSASHKSNSCMGAAAEDPISDLAQEGKLPGNIKSFFDRWVKGITKIDAVFPDVKSILVKTSIYHNAGASAVQELAMAIALGVEYLHAGEEHGISIDSLAKKMIFSFSLNSSFFMGIAKLRAARRLWSLAGQAYRAERNAFKMEIHAETSSFTQTLFDPYVNILRSANQSFAAVLGGIQYLEISPFNSLAGNSEEFSDRIARNIHFILGEESHLKKVADPAGGSWYIEELTEQLTNQAWEMFLDIEERGGALAVLESGWIQDQIAMVFEEKNANAMHRQERLIGTNVYADIKEKTETIDLSNLGSRKESLFHSNNDFIPIKALTSKRLSLELEAIRLKTSDIKKNTGDSPKIGLLCLHSLKDYKPRADFVSSFFAAAGIEAQLSSRIIAEDEAVHFIKQTKLLHYCLCGSDSVYETEAIPLLKALKKEFPDIKIYIAGKVEESLASSAVNEGLTDFIHLKTSLGMISDVLEDMEGEINNGKARLSQC